MSKNIDFLPQELIEKKIYIIRGQKVMLSIDLASLYEVAPRSLIQAVKRNIERFPKDFMFQINPSEFLNLKSQFVISSWGGRRFTPYAFTEPGIAMLSSILKSKKAVQVNIAIIRTFIRLRQLLATHKYLADKLKELEKMFQGHDRQIKSIFETLKSVTAPPEKPIGKIGF